MRTGVLSVMLCLGLCLTASATRYHIEPDGTGDFPTIASAISSCVDGDEIELADGIYSGNGNNNILIDGLTVWIFSASGNPSACRIDCEGTPGVTNRAFNITSVWSPKTVILDGIAIENGNAHNAEGGGIYVTGQVAFVMTNVRFRNCHASVGGAFSISSGSSGQADALACHFRGNYADAGAGALNCAGVITTWTDCWFIDNSSGTAAGACLLDFSGETTFSNCVFSRNLAQYYAAAISAIGSGPLVIHGCTFSENACATYATINIGPSVTPTIEHTMVVGSDASAAFNWQAGSVVLNNCNLYDNDGGDYAGPLAGELGSNGNISDDPQFCSPTPHEHENWTLQEDSPCTALNSLWGVQIGAYGRACGTVDPAPVSWGTLKSAFR